MKTAIYIEDGLLQVVITPESDFEKNLLSMFWHKPIEAQIFSGGFYDCRGGWVRQSGYGTINDDRSLILCIAQPPPAEPVATPTSAPTAVSEELNENLDREARAGENYTLRSVGKLNDLIAAGEPRSDVK